MSVIDIWIISLFLCGLVIYGVIQGKSTKSTDEYFLAGRNLPWVTAMFSIVATETSVLTFVSVPGLAYQKDWSFLQLAIGYIFGRILVSWILLPMYFHSGITSIYETLGKRFGTTIQKTASGLFLFTRILADGVRFLATAVIVQVMTGWSLSIAVLVIGGVTILYTLSGGIRTVIWVDTFQFILYLAGGLVTIGFILHNMDGSIASTFSTLSEQSKLQIFHFGNDILYEPFVFLSALIGGMLLSFASHGADHMMVQRVLATKNISSARKAMVGSGLFVFLQFTVFLLAGSLIWIYFGGTYLQKDREFSTFIINDLPIGLKGLLLAGVLSAAMSTMSSSINSLASSTVTDWFKQVPSIRISRIISFAWATALMGIAVIFDEGSTTIIELGLTIASLTYGGLLSLFILSRSNQAFTNISLVVGLIASIGTVLILQEMGIAWTWFIGISVLINLAVTWSSDKIIRWHLG